MTIFVSSNQGKILEVKSILGNKIISQSIELEELQSLDFRIIVEHKLRQAYEQVKQPVIVEDTGLQIQAYGSLLPGRLLSFS
jgi:XTP/dITP diphosphohydrolase